MILDEYFKFERLGAGKAATRFDLVSASSFNHFPICDPNKQGQIFVYLTQPYLQTTNRQRKGTFSLVGRNTHLSSIFTPDPTRLSIGYGDLKGSQDAFLCIIAENDLEIFLAKGKKRQEQFLFTLYADGELDAEVEALRSSAKPYTPITGKAA